MKYQLMVLAVFITSFHLGTSTYDCICHYNVQSIVHSQPNITSKPVGYLYEFDCKPEDRVQSQPDWWAILIEHMIGYIQKGEQLAEQTCNGEIPLPDALTTTPAPQTTRPQISSKKASISTTIQSIRSSGYTQQQTVPAIHVNHTGTGSNITPVNSSPTSYTGLTSATINPSKYSLFNDTTPLRTVYPKSSSNTNSGIMNSTSRVSVISVIVSNRPTGGPVSGNSTHIQQTPGTGTSSTDTHSSIIHSVPQTVLVINTTVATSTGSREHITTNMIATKNKTNSNLTNDTHTTPHSITHISTDSSVFMEKVSSPVVTRSTPNINSSSSIGNISNFSASWSTLRVKPSMNITMRPVSELHTAVTTPSENAYSSIKSSSFVTTSTLNATTTWKSNPSATTTLKSNINASATLNYILNATTTLKSNLNATITTNTILHATTTLKINTSPITTSPTKTTPLSKSSSATRGVFTTTEQPFILPTTDKWNTEMCPYFMLAQTIYNGSLAHPYPLVRRDEAFCYEFSVSTDNWNNARAKCKAKGGDLVVIDDPSTQTLLERMLKDLRFPNDVWIGLSDVITEGKWLWVDGVRDIFNPYMNWDASPLHNPVYNVRRNCAVINGQTGKWGQTVCRTFVLMAARHHYICQYEIN